MFVAHGPIHHLLTTSNSVVNSLLGSNISRMSKSVIGGPLLRTEGEDLAMLLIPESSINYADTHSWRDPPCDTVQ